MSVYGPDGGLSVLSARVTENTERSQISRASRAVISESVPATHCVGNIAIVGGTVYYVAMGLLAGDVVANVVLYVGTAGVGMTLSKAGLYDTAGNLLASSVDQGASWEAAGLKTIAMQTPYAVTRTGAYFAAFVGNSSSTKPNVVRGASSAIMVAAAIGSGVPAFCGQTGQTDLPNPGTLTGGVAANCYWVAVT